MLVLLIIIAAIPLPARAATVTQPSTVYFPWVSNDEDIGGLGPWHGELSFQNLSNTTCALTVNVGVKGSWVTTARLSLTAGAARTVGASSFAVPNPGGPVRLDAGCPLAASVKQITPDVQVAPWSDGAAVVTGYTGLSGADLAASRASATSAWYLPITQTNSDWNTFIRIANFDTAGIDVAVELFPAGNANGADGADLMLSNHLGVAEVWTVDTLYALGASGWVGYARVTVSGDAGVIALRTKASTTMALTNVAIAADAEQPADTYIAAAPLLFNAYNGWNTGINLANVSDEPSDITVSYYAAGGEMLREETLQLLPHSMQYIYTPGSVEAQGFVGSAKIRSNHPVVASIDEVKYETTEGLSYMASSVGQMDAAIPLSFREAPLVGRNDNSGINVSNLNPDAEQQVTITLVNSTGTAILPAPVVLTLPPGGNNFVYLPFVEAIPAGTVAAVRLTSSDPRGFVAISNDINYAVHGDGSVVFPATSTNGYYHTSGATAP